MDHRNLMIPTIVPQGSPEPTELFFPELRVAGEGQWKTPEGLEAKGTLCHLSWDWLQEQAERQHKRAGSVLTPATLPGKACEQELRDALFVYDEDCFYEIEHHARLAKEEWGRYDHFEKHTRTVLLAPAVAHVRTIFEVLNSLLWEKSGSVGDVRRDKRVGYFVRAMLVKFWTHQVSEADVMAYSGLQGGLSEEGRRGLRENESTEEEPGAFVKAMRERFCSPERKIKKRRKRHDRNPDKADSADISRTGVCSGRVGERRKSPRGG